MRLILAEKPSLARAIADALPGNKQRNRLSIGCGPLTSVAWCAGHILEQAPPSSYCADFKRWQLDTLPIVPESWKLEVSHPDLLASIKALLKKATEVVNAGDPDREGQLLVDEVLDYLGWQGPTQRLLINDLSLPAVKKALNELQPNSNFRNLSQSALARQRADWLHGLNLSRLYTLLGQQSGHDGVLSVGRVQTPLLGLVVRRDREIEDFKPLRHYGVKAEFQLGAESSFSGKWLISDEYEGDTDSEGRFLSAETPQAIANAVAGKQATVLEFEERHKVINAPLPYSLAQLQSAASQKLGMSAAGVLEVAQALYEKHQLLTYPRSDCSHLPEGQHPSAPRIIAAISASSEDLLALTRGLQPERKSRAWDDAKVTAHHGIIPTENVRDLGGLTAHERGVYGLVARRYCQQFAAPYEYLQQQVKVAVGKEQFAASGVSPLVAGWQAMEGPASAPEQEEQDGDGTPPAPLGDMQLGQKLNCLSADCQAKLTRSPKRFTDATLIELMCNVSKYVSDPKAKQLLRSDGIGTPATRATIIETLFARNYVERRGKAIRSTPTGRSLIDALPAVATTPDMTAVWEGGIERIASGDMTLEAFMTRVTVQLSALVERGKKQGKLAIAAAHPCAEKDCQGHLRRLKGKNGFFWSCVTCRKTSEDNGGSPTTNQLPRRAKKGKRRSSTRKKSGRSQQVAT